MFLAGSALTRADIEATVRNVYMPEEFNAIQMQEGEDPEEYFTKIDQVVQPLVMLDGRKDIDEANVHIVQFIGVVHRRK